MGLIMNTGSVKSQLSTMNSNLSTTVSNAETLQQKISNFINDEDKLVADSYASVRQYYASLHLSVVRGIICYADDLKNANSKYSGQIDSYLNGVGKVDEDGLLDSLNRIKNMRYSLWRQIISKLAPQLQFLDRILEQQQRDIEEKLEKIEQFISVTEGTYSSVDEIKLNVQKGISGMLGVKFHTATNTFNFIGVDLSWRYSLEDKWEKRSKQIESQQKEEIKKKIESDYKSGKINQDMYLSLISGVESAGTAFIREVLQTKVTDIGAETIANGIVTWLKNNTAYFMNKGLVLEVVSGGEALGTVASSLGAKIVRGGASVGVPIIGTLVDYTMQRATGISSKDATIKASAHTAIGIGGQMAGGVVGAKIGGVIGTAIPIPGIGTAIGAAAGFIIGVAGSMLFDELYDNREKIQKSVKKVCTDVGNAVQGFFSGIGETLFE